MGSRNKDFIGKLYSHTSSTDRQQDVDKESKVLSTANKGEVHHHLRNLNVHNSMGPDEMHLSALRDLADIVAKLLSMIF